MNSELSTFERRMEEISIIKNRKIISALELARWFDVSYSTMARDISDLSRFVPIACKMGRHGGVYIIDEYKCERIYLTRDEEKVIERLILTLKGRDKELLQMVLYKFALPKAK